MIRVSVIIITYNSSGTIAACLRSLSCSVFRDFEVIVLDNSSTDDTRRALESARKNAWFPMRIFYLERNLGFAEGNNRALLHVSDSSAYVALLNADAFPDRGWLARLVDAMDLHPEAGICASKMIAHGPNTIDSAGDGFSSLMLKGFKRGEGEPFASFDHEEYVFGACAGAALYRRNMLTEVGFFDGDFFLIHEDTDLNFRAQLAGWKVLYVPSALVYHKVRSSIGSMSDIAVFHTVRNCELVRLKNIPAPLFLKLLPSYLLTAVAELIYFGIKHGRMRLYLKAKSEAFKMIPSTLRKRAVIMDRKKLDNRSLAVLMTSAWRRGFITMKLKKWRHG